MTEFQYACNCRKKTRSFASFKRKYKKQVHRANRRVGKKLDTRILKLDAWEVV